MALIPIDTGKPRKEPDLDVETLKETRKKKRIQTKNTKNNKDI